MFKLRGAVAAGGLVALLSLGAAPNPSAAAIFSYDVDAAIAGGGSLEGSFSYNSSAPPFTSNISALALQVTNDPYADTTYDTSNIPFAFLEIQNDLNGAGEVTGTLETNEFGSPQISVTFPFPSGGGIITKTSSQFGDSFYAPGDGVTQFISGTVTPAGTAGAAPEPATWALMLVGLGIVGAGLRSGRVRLQA